MEFPKINESACPAIDEDGLIANLPQDARCSETTFSSENPTLCPNRSRLIIKPELITVCSDSDPVFFKGFLQDNDGETAVAYDDIIIVSDAGTSAANGTYEKVSASEYQKNDASGYAIIKISSTWYLYTPLTVVLYSISNASFPLGTWTVGSGDSPAPTAIWGVEYASSDASVVTIDAQTGEATIVSSGVATISVRHGDQYAFAQVNVSAGTNCCDSVGIDYAYVLDISVSASESFGGGYADRLSVGKVVARQLIRQLNTDKENASIVKFNEAADIVISLTNVIGDEYTDDSLLKALATVSQSDKLTSIKSGFDAALVALAGGDADRRIIVILSDGQNRPFMPISEQAAFLAAAQSFKSSGGIIICVGLRAYGDGFAMLRNIASGGFFVNIIEGEDVPSTIEVLAGLQCYFCGGNRPMADGYTCLSAPPVAQQPDAFPLTDPELNAL